MASAHQIAIDLETAARNIKQLSAAYDEFDRQGIKPVHSGSTTGPGGVYMDSLGSVTSSLSAEAQKLKDNIAKTRDALVDTVHDFAKSDQLGADAANRILAILSDVAPSAPAPAPATTPATPAPRRF